MTKTAQSNICKAVMYVNNKNLHTQKPETEDNMGIYLSMLDDMNKLYKNLSRINYLIQKMNIEQIFPGKDKGTMI